MLIDALLTLPLTGIAVAHLVVNYYYAKQLEEDAQ